METIVVYKEKLKDLLFSIAEEMYLAVADITELDEETYQELDEAVDKTIEELKAC
jgi:hypothetical protein